MQKQRVVVVGAGLGGLAAAIRCAAAGYQTTLLDARDQVGGKLNIIRDQGFVWDIGPSLLTMPWVIDDLLRQSGSSLAAELDVVPLDSACRYIWPDGTQFDAWTSFPSLLKSVESIEPRDVGNFLRFMTYAERMWSLTADTFLYSVFRGWRSMIDWRLLRDAWQLDGMRTMHRAVESFFVSPKLQQVMNRFATYNGSSPYRTPATFNLIAWAEFGLGAYYPRGGMYRIAEVLHAAALRVGVDIRLDTPVVRIEHRKGQVVGVHTQMGEFIAADAVVSNVDPQVTINRLVDGETKRAQPLLRRELSCSGFVILWGIDTRYDLLDHHTIFFSPDYRAEFADTDAGRLHPTPTIYINHTVQYDTNHAPPGGQNIFVLVNVPPTRNASIDWSQIAESYAEQIAQQLECYGLTDLRQHIVTQKVITPIDLEQMYGAPGGAIYGLASNTITSAFVRPTQQDAKIKGLFYCGGGTHPGGGVPLALLSGKHAAQLVTNMLK
jgi:phytoene desaturase